MGRDLSLAGGPSASPFYWPSVAQETSYEETEPPLTEEEEHFYIAWNFVFVLIYIVIYKQRILTLNASWNDQ